MRELWGLLRTSGRVLLLLVAVKGIAGFGQGGLLLFVPLYLQQTVGMDSLGIGFHVALLTGVGIATAPLFGMLSDRIGRAPVVVIVLAGQTSISVLLALMGEGIMFTVLVALMGAFMHTVEPIIQAWGLDVAHGRKPGGNCDGDALRRQLSFTRPRAAHNGRRHCFPRLHRAVLVHSDNERGGLPISSS